MKTIPLTRGMEALVDDRFHGWLSNWTWRAKKSRNTHYAVVASGPPSHSVLMHHFLVAQADGLLVDHKDLNGLNNQWGNLRYATNQQNQFNTGSRNGSRSRFKGVSWDWDRMKWRAVIRAEGGKQKHLGYFAEEHDAAVAYDGAAALLHGEHARFNLPREGQPLTT